MKNRKKQSLKFIIVLAIMFIGIGYAYLTTTLSINGTTDIDSNSWNIYWDNIQVVDGSVTGDQITQAPVIDSSLTSVSFHVRLKEPGEYYEFTVDAVNAGTIDAMVETVTKTSDIPIYLRYTVTYNSGVPIAAKQRLNANSTETYKVRVEYRTDIYPDNLPSSPQSLNLSFGVEYVQADDSAMSVSNSSFTISCSRNNVFFFNEGMTFSDWLKSEFYPGDVGGEYSTLEECINVWGSNAGCSHREEDKYYYRYVYPEYKYTESLNICNSYLNCTTLNNSLYKGEYSFSDYFYDTYEDCKNASEYNECRLINGKYVGFIAEDYYATLDECNSLSTWTDYYSCSLLPLAYKYNDYYEREMDSLEECLEEYPSENCLTRATEFYGPNKKEGTISGFEFRWGPIFNSSDKTFYYRFDYDTVLENKNYSCRCIAECVSPESDILSGNGKTIKAKNIKENDFITYYNFYTNRTEIGRVGKVYIHKDATSLIRYEFEDNTFLEATDYHPIYTKEGWKSYTNRNGYPKPVIGDLVKTDKGYKRITKIVPYTGKEDYYDFQVISKDGKKINNYYANGTLVQGSY